MTSAENPDARVTELETLVTHLQHDLEQMSNVLLTQKGEIDALTRSVEKLERRLEVLEQPPEERDLLEERPPHY